jgi:hypothetical protein
MLFEESAHRGLVIGVEGPKVLADQSPARRLGQRDGRRLRDLGASSRTGPLPSAALARAAETEHRLDSFEEPRPLIAVVVRGQHDLDLGSGIVREQEEAHQIRACEHRRSAARQHRVAMLRVAQQAIALDAAEEAQHVARRREVAAVAAQRPAVAVGHVRPVEHGAAILRPA